MKVVCINDGYIFKDIIINGVTHRSIQTGDFLKKGEIYTSSGIVKNASGHQCYFIKELQEPKLIERFREVDDSWVSEVLENILNTEEKQVLVMV